MRYSPHRPLVVHPEPLADPFAREAPGAALGGPPMPLPLATPAGLGRPPADRAGLAHDLERLMRASRAYRDAEQAAAERAAQQTKEKAEHRSLAAQLGRTLFPRARTPLVA